MDAIGRRAFLATCLGAVATAGCQGGGSAPRARASAAPTVAPSRMGPVPARWSDEVCQAYALNTKTFYDSSVYQYNDAVVDLLTELGVRTVRERVTTGTSPGALAQRRVMPILAERGIRWHATVATLENWPRAAEATASALRVLTDAHRPAVGGDLTTLLHSLGGCNEVDGPVVDGAVDPSWPQHARLMQTQLWRQAKADPRTEDIPVAGPSTRTDVTPERARALGDLSDVSDWGNAHLYGAGTSPTRGIDEQLETLAPVFPDPDLWFFTETGYSNSPQDNAGRSVSEGAAATYALRAICDFFVRGCIYGRFELMDDPDAIDSSSQAAINATADRQAHYGLVAVEADTVEAATPNTWRKKPEFEATRRLLALMSDRGPRHHAEPLALSFGETVADLQHALVQKRDGRHYLLLWRDVEVATTFPAPRALDVAPVRVRVGLPTSRPIAVYSPRHSDAPVVRQPPDDTVTVDVAGDLLVLEIG